MNYIQTRNRSSIRILAAFLAAFLLVLMLFSTTAHADFDSAACNYLQISFMQVQQNNLSTLLALNEGLYYKSPNLGGVYAHVMDVAGDDGQVGIGFCGNHAKALNSRQVRNDTWTYAGLWTPGGSAPFLDYYYATNFESDLIRAENPGQTEEWYAGALNTEEWGYAKYCTASQMHRRMANQLLAMGNEFYVEDMRWKALAKRTKETRRNKKGKILSKTRYGKSIANKAPAMFLAILEQKVIASGGSFQRIVTWKAKASQFSHETGKCNKKKLSQRWHYLEDGTKVQRDLYSAFLIQHTNKNLESFNLRICEKDFPIFLKMHQEEIERLQSLDKRMPSSMGIKKTA